VGTSGTGAWARRDDERSDSQRGDDQGCDYQRCDYQRSAPTIRTWERGASGERIVGARLERIDGIELLHDRRIPGTRATIDHIAVGPGGVYVVDAKLYGTMVKPRGLGRFRHVDRRFWIRGHDESQLVAKVGVQVNALTRALNEAPIPVTPALCFVDAQWPLPAEPFMLNGVWVGWPDVLPDLVNRPGLLDTAAIRTTARLLDARLPLS
jgi:Nuclease-related domain